MMALGPDFDHLLMLILGFSMMDNSLLYLYILIWVSTIIISQNIFVERKLKPSHGALIWVRKLFMRPVLANLVAYKPLLSRLVCIISLMLLKVLLGSHRHQTLVELLLVHLKLMIITSNIHSGHLG